VPLVPAEGVAARKRGLAVLADGRAFEQPCTALAEGTASTGERTCAAYAERPAACRRFVCRLYVRHLDEGGSLEPRLAAVARAKELLLAALRERSGPAVTELEQRMAEDFARAAET
jgi:Fe-S-cluster containining protein